MLTPEKLEYIKSKLEQVIIDPDLLFHDYTGVKRLSIPHRIRAFKKVLKIINKRGLVVGRYNRQMIDLLDSVYDDFMKFDIIQDKINQK